MSKPSSKLKSTSAFSRNYSSADSEEHEQPILQLLQEEFDIRQKQPFFHLQMGKVSAKPPPQVQENVPHKRKLTFEEQLALEP